MSTYPETGIGIGNSLTVGCYPNASITTAFITCFINDPQLILIINIYVLLTQEVLEH